MQTYFYVGNSECSLPLIPEIALAILIEKDYAENIYGVYENYCDACAAAKKLSAEKGKTCPIIVLAVDGNSDYVSTVSFSLYNEDKLSGRRRSLFTSQLQAFHISPPAIIIKQASFVHDATQEPEISFQYEKLEMHKVNIELDNLRRERREAFRARVIQDLNTKNETSSVSSAAQTSVIEDPNLTLRPPEHAPSPSETELASKRRKMGS